MKYIFIIFKAIFTLPNIIVFNRFVGRDKDFLMVKNSNIESISQLILSEFKNNFLKINEIKDKKLKENIKNYHFNITSFFQKKTLDEIENQLKNKNLLSNISNHFGFKIKFSQFMIRYNYYNPLSPEQFGPKMWHRDNDSLFNQLKFFLVINEL